MQVTYGKGFAVAKNSPMKVQFRQTVLAAQVEMQNMIDSGAAESMLEDCTLKHYFTPKDEKYGCSTYAREIFLPKGSFVIGKIHRHQHLNFISNGKVKVYTEFGEKHFEAPSLKFDLKYLKEKVANGASFIVTQMFFDNQKYFDYVAKVREAGIDVPIIPGIKPISTLGQITALPRSFFLDFPDDLTDALFKCTTNAQVKEVGIEWAIKQCKELMAAKVPSLHFYTMSKAETTYKVAKELF
jgi:hypothetical protein